MATTIIDYTPGDSPIAAQSSTRHKLLPIKLKCPECPVEECETCCPSEMGQPHYVAAGDVLYLQYFFEDLVNPDPKDPTLGWKESGMADGEYWIALELYDHQGNLITDNIDEMQGSLAWATWHNGEQSIQQAVIGVSSQMLPCFHFCIRVYVPDIVDYKIVSDVYPPGDLPPIESEGTSIMMGNFLWTVVNGAWKNFGECEAGDLVYETKTGLWYQSDGSVLTELGDEPDLVNDPFGPFTRCCTNLYKVVTCEESFEVVNKRIKGKDCFGFVYDTIPEARRNGVPGFNERHNFRKRYPGSVEVIAYPITREETDNEILVQGYYSERARVRTSGVCRYDAEYMAALIASEDFLIEGISWSVVTDTISRNNDNGLLWWLDFEIERTICEGTDSCEFDPRQ